MEKELDEKVKQFQEMFNKMADKVEDYKAGVQKKMDQKDADIEKLQKQGRELKKQLKEEEDQLESIQKAKEEEVKAKKAQDDANQAASDKAMKEFNDAMDKSEADKKEYTISE